MLAPLCTQLLCKAPELQQYPLGLVHMPLFPIRWHAFNAEITFCITQGWRSEKRIHSNQFNLERIYCSYYMAYGVMRREK